MWIFSLNLQPEQTTVGEPMPKKQKTVDGEPMPKKTEDIRWRAYAEKAEENQVAK